MEPETTRIIALSDDHEADGAQFFIQLVKNKFDSSAGWREKHFVNTLRDIESNVQTGYSLVLLDDFIGTGRKFDRKAKWLNNKLESFGIMDIDLYFFSIGGMRQAIPTLDRECLAFEVCEFFDRGISDRYEGQTLVEYTTAMDELEKGLSPKFRKLALPNFGYRGSEALFYIFGMNAPNNNFPIFWWPETYEKHKRLTMFPILI